ncbi:MAG: exodeoxyribonuclease VII large subunit [Sulfurimonadaceae bacterium]|jgi:exodeoxyribonuclease VII large subunit|nr:exodeoxyribonuclease VII large subunit [Sulfurimonadaceae bacterium]
MRTLSVSACNEQIKALLESSFSHLYIEGELSRITVHNSGHIYFTLKDATSTLKAVMFRGNASKLKFQLKEGMKVIVDGALSVYTPRGEYQLNCFSIEPAGHGALALAYEQLKQKLSTQGYFEPMRKKQIPRFVEKIALITSATGAALQDMLRVAENRYRALEIDVYDVLVQGNTAAFMIAEAIKKSDAKGYDAIVVGRGGGSIEDLWAFNEEIVADAIFYAKTPIVSAVGHEIDFVISDFVADLRAPTPSAAMEMILPDTNELLLYLDTLSSQYQQTIGNKFLYITQQIHHLKNSFQNHSIEKKLLQKKDEISQLKESFTQGFRFKLQNFAKEVEHIKVRFPHAIDNIIALNLNQLLHLQKMLESNHPKLKNKSGFAQISKDTVVVQLEMLEIDDIFEAMSDKVKISAKVVSKTSL